MARATLYCVAGSGSDALAGAGDPFAAEFARLVDGGAG